MLEVRGHTEAGGMSEDVLIFVAGVVIGLAIILIRELVGHLLALRREKLLGKWEDLDQVQGELGSNPTITGTTQNVEHVMTPPDLDLLVPSLFDSTGSGFDDWDLRVQFFSDFWDFIASRSIHELEAMEGRYQQFAKVLRGAWKEIVAEELENSSVSELEIGKST
jgi:hypothetical protein